MSWMPTTALHIHLAWHIYKEALTHACIYTYIYIYMNNIYIYIYIYICFTYLYIYCADGLPESSGAWRAPWLCQGGLGCRKIIFRSERFTFFEQVIFSIE